jgi:methionine sulfoxide reductase heme-binding subunit
MLAIRTCIWLLALTPLVWVVWLGVHNELGPDPGKALDDYLGLWALRLLLITLAMRPLREITGKAIFLQLRRLLGLFAWFYASLHFAAGIFYVIGWSAPELLRAISERGYIILGFAAWLMLLPLGVTSNRWAQRKLGRSWRRLHQLIYPLAMLACLHFIWLVRSDYWQPALYALALTILLGWRLPWRGCWSQARTIINRYARLSND